MKPHFHSQNLNENRQGNIIGSMFWHGRAWYHAKREIHWEWLLGRKARGFSVTASFGNGDGDDGLLLHICLPFLFSLYFGVAGVYRCRESQIGVTIHNEAIWVYPFSLRMDSPKENDPWWRRHYSWYFPWSHDWHSTEVLCPYFFGPAIWKETRSDRRKGRDAFKVMDEQNKAAASVTEEYDYTYTRKSGEVQNVKAKIHVTRMVWRMRWWPLLPFSKSRTSIHVDFSSEVGEGTGSWKGGTTGCGYDMLPGESALSTLRRMQSERKFDR